MRLFTRSTFTALCLLLVAALAAPTASALGTEFTYQGRLQDDIAPAARAHARAQTRACRHHPGA